MQANIEMESSPLTIALQDNIAILTIDLPGEPLNVLKPSFSLAFERCLDELELRAELRGIVLISGKPDSFIVGADITILESIRTAEEATELSRRAQATMNRIGALRMPVVAAIHGTCLGGGLELALACHGRVASDDPKTELGLPEVQLGLIPAAGGTQRLPRLIGIPEALDLMLTGKKVRAEKARKLGFLDEVVPRSILLPTAMQRVFALAQSKPAVKGLSKVKDVLQGFADKHAVQRMAIEHNALIRKTIFGQARKELQKKTFGNYPAPEKIISAVEEGLTRGMMDGLQAEARLFGECLVTPQSRELIGLFFASTSLKKDKGISNQAIVPRKLERVGILGAGLMGSGIAYVSIHHAGVTTRLKDRDEESITRGIKTVRTLIDGRVERKRLKRMEADLLMQHLTASSDYRGFDRCDIVIEAVFEDLQLKHQMIRDIEAITPDTTIFASNTSSIPISRIAQGSKRPGNVIGMHYFSPVDKMPLLEIIVTDQTTDETTAACVELGKKQGKTVIVVRDGVGFYTSRILAPYMNEAAYLLAEGVAIDSIDRALKSWGFPVGPMALLDEVGIDVGEKVGHIMIETFGSRMQPPAVMQKLVADGRKGRKNQKGFYRYGGKRKEVDESVYKLLGITPDKKRSATEIAERCALVMVNEALHCLGENILRSPRDGDIGAVFGLGFPPFRGGPFRFVDDQGAPHIVRMLEQYAENHGDRFAPAPLLLKMAREGRGFYR